MVEHTTTLPEVAAKRHERNMNVPLYDAAIVDVRGYKLPETSIRGYLRVSTHRREDTARAAAAKDGSIAFILRWQSEVGNYVYGLYITEETYYARRAAKRAGANRDPVRRKVNVSLEDLRRAVDAAKERDRRENTVTSFRAYERALEAFHGHRPQASLSELQLNALCLAASRKSGLVTTGMGYTSAKATLQSLARLGLLAHQASGGAYYRYWSQYKITDAGRAAALENCAHYVRGTAK